MCDVMLTSVMMSRVGSVCVVMLPSVMMSRMGSVHGDVAFSHDVKSGQCA